MWILTTLTLDFTITLKKSIDQFCILYLLICSGQIFKCIPFLCSKFMLTHCSFNNYNVLPPPTTTIIFLGIFIETIQTVIQEYIYVAKSQTIRIKILAPGCARAMSESLLYKTRALVSPAKCPPSLTINSSLVPNDK